MNSKLEMFSLKPKEIKLDNGNTVWLRRMNGAERVAWIEALSTQQDATKIMLEEIARLLSFCLIDSEGNRIFSDSEVETIKQMDSVAFNMLGQEAMDLNGLSTVAREEAKKKLNSGYGKFLSQLARTFKTPITKLLTEMSATELLFWEETYQQEFLGDERDDLRMGIIVSNLINWSGRLVDGAHIKAVDVMPYLTKEPTVDEVADQVDFTFGAIMARQEVARQQQLKETQQESGT